MGERLKQFREFREKMNERILAGQNLNINRFFTLDGAAYKTGACDELTKEFAGLSASMVLRCDDCIAYHVIRCKECGAPTTSSWKSSTSASSSAAASSSHTSAAPSRCLMN